MGGKAPGIWSLSAPADSLTKNGLPLRWAASIPFLVWITWLGFGGVIRKTLFTPRKAASRVSGFSRSPTTTSVPASLSPCALTGQSANIGTQVNQVRYQYAANVTRCSRDLNFPCVGHICISLSFGPPVLFYGSHLLHKIFCTMWTWVSLLG